MIDEFARFGVVMRDYRWYYHGPPESAFNPVCILMRLVRRPWWASKTHIPIRLSDLVESARRGVWCVTYPENERRD